MLIAVAGFAASGKNSVAEILVKDFGFTSVALADAVRDWAIIINPIVTVHIDGWNDDALEQIRLSELVSSCGWEVAKRTYPEVRRLLQVIGTEVGRNKIHENFWIDELHLKYGDLESPHTRYVLTDARFENEGEYVHQMNGALIWVSRPGIFAGEHSSESGELEPMADWKIDNDSDLDKLASEVAWFAECHGFSKHRR